MTRAQWLILATAVLLIGAVIGVCLAGLLAAIFDKAQIP